MLIKQGFLLFELFVALATILGVVYIFAHWTGNLVNLHYSTRKRSEALLKASNFLENANLKDIADIFQESEQESGQSSDQEEKQESGPKITYEVIPADIANFFWIKVKADISGKKDQEQYVVLKSGLSSLFSK